MTDEQILKVMEMLGRLDTRTALIERLLMGNGQPGLYQRVDDLNGSKNKMWGIGAGVTFVAGLVEYLLHRR